MDNGSLNPTKRLFPAYTTAQLKGFLADKRPDQISPDTRANMELEVSRREIGLSKTLHEILNPE